MAHRFFKLKNRSTLDSVVFAIIIATLFYLVWLNSYDRLDDIKKAPEMYYDQNVWLRGEVGNAYALPMVGSIYYLTDKSGGGIWIISKIDHVTEGDTINLHGMITPEFSIKDSRILGLLENNKVSELGPFLLETSRDPALASLQSFIQ